MWTAARRTLLPSAVFGISLCVSSVPAFAILCKSVTLKSASGVIGNKHSYAVSGICGAKAGKYGQGHSENLSFDAQAIGKASWDRASGLAEEVLTFSGTQSGKRVATAICTQDPFLKAAPGGAASCKNFKVQVQVTGGQTQSYLLAHELWLRHSIALAEAQALSLQGTPSAATPPPPKPSPKKPQPLASTAGDGNVHKALPKPAHPSDAGGGIHLSIEAEELVASGRFKVNGGKVVIQPMGPFGPGWSGNQQLFWAGGVIGAVLDLIVDIPVAGTYTVDLYLTRAPDYGLVRVEFDHQASAATYNGYAPKVTAPNPSPIGKFSLQPGPRRLALMIVGKAPPSTNYFVGVDRIRIRSVGVRDASGR